MMHPDLLIVEDDDATREGLRELLTSAGLVVDEAKDGAAALAKLTSRRFAVVLLDVRLPDIDGLDLLACIVDTPDPPRVVVMTGVDTTETVLNALRGKAYDFLQKPIEPARLVAMIKRAIAIGGAAMPFEVVSARPEWIEILVPCTREAVDRVQSFMQQLEGDLSDEVRDSIGLAFRELLLNGIEWGGQLDPEQRVRVACLRTQRMRLYRIADPGPGFTFDTLSHAALRHDNALAHDAVRQERGIRPGGFGLVLIRAIADELIYNERQNEVVFVKYLDQSAGDSVEGPCREDAMATRDGVG